jgi:hypothetical protein
MITASLVFAAYALTATPPIKVTGGELVGTWDAKGERIRYVPAAPPKRVQYFLVRLSACDGRRPVRVQVQLGRIVKRYKLECAPEVYLEWERTRPDKTYQKTLIRRGE